MTVKYVIAPTHPSDDFAYITIDQLIRILMETQNLSLDSEDQICWKKRCKRPELVNFENFLARIIYI
ncbi:hypothetical protein KAR91_42145, partial [Candidatus Pacearchaeota archaeon]|nr:hypothetical protein [Candidatus Pacearchaeota archaeon]